MEVTRVLFILGFCVVASLCEPEPSLLSDKGGLFGLQPLDLKHLLPAKRQSDDSSYPCTCAVFLSSQIKEKGRPPNGLPVLSHVHENASPCNLVGFKQCVNRCLEHIVKFLPKSADIMCAAIEDDCYRERAFLYIKNCDDNWTETNMSAGREFCCRNNAPIKCSQVDAERLG